jgi:hypothetical protein
MAVGEEPDPGDRGDQRAEADDPGRIEAKDRSRLDPVERGTERREDRRAQQEEGGFLEVQPLEERG